MPSDSHESASSISPAQSRALEESFGRAASVRSNNEAPRGALADGLVESTEQGSVHGDLARTDWTRMTAADVAATAAYAVSLSRDAAQATAFMIRRASSSPAFRKVLAPEGLQLGQTFSDLCDPAVSTALADRGWS